MCFLNLHSYQTINKRHNASRMVILNTKTLIWSLTHSMQGKKIHVEFFFFFFFFFFKFFSKLFTFHDCLLRREITHEMPKPICSRKIRKQKVVDLPSPEWAQRMVKVKKTSCGERVTKPQSKISREARVLKTFQTRIFRSGQKPGPLVKASLAAYWRLAVLIYKLKNKKQLS